jgi:peptide deformylase
LKLAVIDNQRDDPLVLINPRFVKKSDETDTADEGCLSVPGFAGPVVRAKRVTIRTGTLEGGSRQLTASGYLARIIQHEMDHLDGVLYIDRVDGELRRVDADYLAEQAMSKLAETGGGTA